jgi:hypothetical protein
MVFLKDIKYLLRTKWEWYERNDRIVDRKSFFFFINMEKVKSAKNIHVYKEMSF